MTVARRWIRLIVHHPSAVLFIAQVLGVLLYPLLETAPHGPLVLNVFGLGVLILAVRMVRRTPGLTGVAVALAAPAVVLAGLQVFLGMAWLLPWSSALEAAFYFHAAISLIAYMMSDDRTTVDELFAAAATFTLLAWGYTHLFVLTQALQPQAFMPAGSSAPPRSWSELNHLAFALLSSTGMGPVVAESPFARALASLAMLTGVMYLATVVARLIGFTVPRRP